MGTASQDASPLSDSPALKSESSVSKLSAALHSETAGQQFKSPRLQQLLGNRTAVAGSLLTGTAAAVKSEDSLVPAHKNEVTSSAVAVQSEESLVPAHNNAAIGSVTTLGSEDILVPADNNKVTSSATTVKSEDGIVPPDHVEPTDTVEVDESLQTVQV